MISMKILIPTNSKDEDAKVSEVFGRSKCLAIYDTESKEIEFTENPGVSKTRGAGITTAQYALDKDISKVVAVQVGPNAKNVLEKGEVEIELAKEKTVKEIIQEL